MKTKLKQSALVFLLLSTVAYGVAMKTLYKLTKLSPSEVAVYCNDGSDPTGNKVGDTLIITCKVSD